MERVRTWVAGAVVGVLLLPVAGAASAGPVPAAPLTAALPVPTAVAPRAGFVDTSDELRSLSLSWNGGTGVAAELAGGTAAAAPVARPDALARAAAVAPTVADGGGTSDGSGAPRPLADGGGTSDGSGGTGTGPVVDSGATTSAASSPTTLALGSVPPVFGSPSFRDDYELRQSHRVDGQAHVLATARQGVLAAWVSTQDSEGDPNLPDPADRSNFGDVYLADMFSGTPPPDTRVTCDAAQEVHPVVSPGGHHVAYASNASGRWVVMVAEVPPAGEGSCEAAAPEAVTAADVDSTWPTWLDDGHLIVSQVTEEAPLGGLYRIDLGATSLDPVLLTSGTVGSTQPDVRSVGKNEAFVLAYTTTEYRPDGSIQFMQLDDDGRPVQRVDGEGEPLFDANGDPITTIDPYAGAEDSRVQGSEPAWSPDDSDFDLLFTSTQDDPVGGVWVGVWDLDAPLSFAGQLSLVDVVGVTESHATWVTDFRDDNGFAFAQVAYTSEVVSPDVTDVVADDGSDVRTVSDEGFFPSGDTLQAFAGAGPGVHYSPDGAQVAFSTPVGGEGDTGAALHLARADDLTAVPFDYERDDADIDVDPVWSPDGSTIAFVRAASDGDGGHQPSHLWIVSVRDDETFGEATQVTMSDEDASHWDSGPTWSPDGTHLAFARISQSGESPAVGPQIWVVDVESQQADPLFVTECGCGGLAVFGRSPSWSPDGTRIAVADLVTDIPAESDLAIDARGGIGVVELSPDEVTRVLAVAPLTGIGPDGTATPTRLQVGTSDDPEWSPDGREIAFSGSPAGQAKLRAIWAVSPDGATLRRVVDLTGPQRAPAYQPFTDLVLTLSAGPVTGGAATVTATVTNTGPALVREATVTVELPAGLSSPGAPGCTQSGAFLTCPVTGPLAAGGTVAFAIPVQGISSTTASTISGLVQTSTPERVVGNNTTSVTVRGVPVPDGGVAGGVSVTVAGSSPVAFVGGHPVTVTFTVRNVGTLPVQDVALTTAYPAIVSVAPGGGSPCLVAAGSCPVGTLAGGASVVLTATLDPNLPFTGPPQSGTTTGTVTTTSPDPAPADNTASATLEVRQPVVVLAPSVARPGEVVFAVGHDFPPGEAVNLRWSQGLLSVRNPVVARDDGSWSQSIVVIRDTLLTQRDLRASNGQPSPAYGDVTAPLLVVPTSVDAPTFLFRK
ncbi:hypothetical protein [Cellulomonas sp. URHB0016]